MPTIEKRPAPPEFVDLTGRSWPLRITLAHTSPLKEIGLKLTTSTAPADFQAAADFATRDHETTAAILWALVESHAKKEGISQESFFDSLDGPCLFSAQEPLVAAIAEFGQPPEVAKIIRDQLSVALAEHEAKIVKAIKSSHS